MSLRSHFIFRASFSRTHSSDLLSHATLQVGVRILTLTDCRWGRGQSLLSLSQDVERSPEEDISRDFWWSEEARSIPRRSDLYPGTWLCTFRRSSLILLITWFLGFRFRWKDWKGSLAFQLSLVPLSDLCSCFDIWVLAQAAASPYGLQPLQVFKPADHFLGLSPVYSA